jgi:NAD(P)-dependent dehydrogenase (short-subunit alcohol dehydrogenase family)
MFCLDDRTALITGGGGGALGSAIADLLTQAGARVVVAGRRQAAGDHASVAFDVTDDGKFESGIELGASNKKDRVPGDPKMKGVPKCLFDGIGFHA